MTRVCLVGAADVDLDVELLASETARDALASYELREPFANSVAIETISLGAAVSLLNDLNWYLVRYVSDALVLEPSITGAEWLSRDLATAIRNEAVEPAETGSLLKIYGLLSPDSPAEPDGDPAPPRLVDPLYVQRVGGETPAYDLREVDDTVIIRITPSEFGSG